jgi:hypothetical protein
MKITRRGLMTILVALAALVMMIPGSAWAPSAIDYPLITPDGSDQVLGIDDPTGAWAISRMSINDVTGDKAIQIVLSGGGAALLDQTMACVEIPWTGTIVASRLYADQSGSVVVDWWTDTYANYIPTNADSITAAATPTIAANDKDSDITLTGWTTGLTEDYSLCAVVEGNATNITQVTAVLRIQR